MEYWAANGHSPRGWRRNTFPIENSWEKATEKWPGSFWPIHMVVLFLVYELWKMKMRMHRTNIEIDETLVREAMELTKQKTKKAVVNFALKELVGKEKRKKLLAFEGKVEWRGNLGEMRTDRA